jgi:hypothetical protein
MDEASPRLILIGLLSVWKVALSNQSCCGNMWHEQPESINMSLSASHVARLALGLGFPLLVDAMKMWGDPHADVTTGVMAFVVVSKGTPNFPPPSPWQSSALCSPFLQLVDSGRGVLSLPGVVEQLQQGQIVHGQGLLS